MQNNAFCLTIMTILCLCLMSLPVFGQVEMTEAGFFSIGLSTEKVTTSELADIAMPNRGFYGLLRKYESTFLDFSWDTVGYLKLTETQYGDLWTTNVMTFIGPRFYLRHPKNLSGVFAGTGIGLGWKSLQMNWELYGMSLGTETQDYFALTGMVSLGFNLMFTRSFGIEGAYYRSAELVSNDKFRYRQFTLGLTFGTFEH